VRNQALQLDQIVSLVKELQTSVNSGNRAAAAAADAAGRRVGGPNDKHSASAPRPLLHTPDHEIGDDRKFQNDPVTEENGRLPPQGSLGPLTPKSVIRSATHPARTTRPASELAATTHICSGRTFDPEAPGFMSTKGASCYFQNICVAPGRGVPPGTWPSRSPSRRLLDGRSNPHSAARCRHTHTRAHTHKCNRAARSSLLPSRTHTLMLLPQSPLIQPTSGSEGTTSGSTRTPISLQSPTSILRSESGHTKSTKRC
jgi:hypothetical protein